MRCQGNRNQSPRAGNSGGGNQPTGDHRAGPHGPRSATGEPVVSPLPRGPGRAAGESRAPRTASAPVEASRKDLSRETVAAIAQKKQWMKSYSLKTAVLKHPKTPRHVALPLLRFMYLFDLVEIAAAVGSGAGLKARGGGRHLGAARRARHRATPCARSPWHASGGWRAVERSGPASGPGGVENPALTQQAVAAALQVEKGTAEATAAVAEKRPMEDPSGHQTGPSP